MERLTIDTNILFCDIAQCREVPGGEFCKDGYCDQRRVYERLREYERLGTVEELTTLAKARDEGRVVVLPCRGQTMNDDLISRSALLEKLKPLEAVGGAELYRSACNEIIHKFFPKLICDQPAIDAAPVVHAHIIGTGYNLRCPHCGAKMDAKMKG